ncbi:hypothetical protein B9Z55_021072 [Caenorhabditis nigoni]|uniref:Uncharacterized protein n=1 Tax=Caenorhabditis nigoni TaxID=1611254 RepID=A0A2G5TQE4_9PELO|nr:hypothetical protein B9Z55_021072 [Caenorhabditis nigoni]
MDEAVIKEEVIEEICNFTFKNGEYVEVKQEEIEQKPEYHLEKEIKTETIEFFDNNNSDSFFEDVKPEPIESGSKIEKMTTGISELICRICQKRIPRSRSKLITTEEDETVLSHIFKFQGFMEKIPNYVCVSHIQKIINDIEDKVKIPGKPSDTVMRSFVRRNKYLMQVNVIIDNLNN